jgi:hypothetical protein
MANDNSFTMQGLYNAFSPGIKIAEDTVDQLTAQLSSGTPLSPEDLLNIQVATSNFSFCVGCVSAILKIIEDDMKGIIQHIA